MPLVDMRRPVAAQLAAGDRRLDRVVADLGMTVGVLIDPCAEMPGQHLRAEADSEIWLLLLDRDADPFDLALDDLVVVVGALRPAEDHGTGVVFERLGQIVAKTR